MHERLQYLFGRYLENKCSRKELEELFTCIRQAKHDEALRQLIRNVYHDIRNNPSSLISVDENGQLKFDEAAWLNHEIPDIPSPRPRKKFSTAILIAVVVLVGVAAWILAKPSRPPAAGMTLSAVTKKATNRSESKFLLLADSTQVWLNAASSLEFPDQFSKEKREVYLSGEAYFDVQHADRIPFIIHTGNISTTVLGTAFNIKAYPGQRNITVSVNRGKVRISYGDSLLTTLVRGQEAKVRNEGAVTEKNIAIAGIATWQQGDMVYDGETFGDIIADIERIYNADIQIENNAVKDLNVSTSFRKEIGVEQALQVLCKLTDTELKNTGTGYLIR